MRKKRKKRPFDRATRALSAILTPGSLRLSTRGARQGCWLALAVTLALWGLSLLPVAAKEKKIPRTVSGIVLDGAENPIVGATVELTDLQTSKKIAMFTQDGGRYQFSDIKPLHDYEVQATYKGVSSEVRKASSFDTRNKIVLNLRIPPPKQ